MSHWRVLQVDWRVSLVRSADRNI